MLWPATPDSLMYLGSMSTNFSTMPEMDNVTAGFFGSVVETTIFFVSVLPE
jgi:hypothetical protein